jgi:hypothetical protein
MSTVGLLVFSLWCSSAPRDTVSTRSSGNEETTRDRSPLAQRDHIESDDEYRPFEPLPIGIVVGLAASLAGQVFGTLTATLTIVLFSMVLNVVDLAQPGSVYDSNLLFYFGMSYFTAGVVFGASAALVNFASIFLLFDEWLIAALSIPVVFFLAPAASPVGALLGLFVGASIAMYIGVLGGDLGLWRGPVEAGGGNYSALPFLLPGTAIGILVGSLVGSVVVAVGPSVAFSVLAAHAADARQREFGEFAE